MEGNFSRKTYTELGWESLSSRRWSRRLTLFYKFVNNLSPDYTVVTIPPLHQSQYFLRNQDVIGRLTARTEKFKSSFYPYCLCEWNKVEPEWRLAPSVSVFKKKLLSIICSPAKSVFEIYDPIGLSLLTQLRVGLSKLNFHKFKHNFRDTINPMCPTSDEDTGRLVLRIQNNFCCSARPLVINEEIFLLDLNNCYDHLCKSLTFQIML